MLLKRFYDDQLAQASYLIGCGAHGTAVVIDPNRMVDQYVAAAEAEGLRITAVTETHIHADFVSGTRELASRTGATMYLSACGPEAWQYAFGHAPGVVLLGDGQSFKVGNIEIRAVHTPGHTPEHISFVVTDTANAHEPMGVATGDFVFVNDVGRPDLLEKAAKLEGTAEAGARQLFRSLTWFKTLPDHLQIWPGHGAGSACGKGMSAVPTSTVGYERRFNWAFGVEDEATFIRMVLEGQPEPPRYFAEMKRINRDGPPLLGTTGRPERLAEGQLGRVLGEGAWVVDTRPATAFATSHVPGTVNIPFNRSFPTWAGSLVPYGRDLYLLVESSAPEAVDRLIESLHLIGLDGVRGWFGPEALELWEGEGRALGRLPQLSVDQLAARRKELLVVDVRGRSEWDAGHVSGARLIPLPELVERMDEVPADRPLAIQCQGGSRSAIAASLLLARGRTQVANVAGGFSAWAQAGLPVER